MRHGPLSRQSIAARICDAPIWAIEFRPAFSLARLASLVLRSICWRQLDARQCGSAALNDPGEEFTFFEHHHRGSAILRLLRTS